MSVLNKSNAMEPSNSFDSVKTLVSLHHLLRSKKRSTPKSSLKLKRGLKQTMNKVKLKQMAPNACGSYKITPTSYILPICRKLLIEINNQSIKNVIYMSKFGQPRGNTPPLIGDT